MLQVPLHRASLLKGFRDYLDEVGTPVDLALRRAGLPGDAFDDLRLFFPSERFRRFVVENGLREGIDSFGFRVGRRFGIGCLDPGMRAALRGQPSLYQGVQYFARFSNQAISNCQVSVIQPQGSGSAYVCHRPSVGDPRNPAHEQIGWFGLTVLLDGVRQFTGADWRPTEIGLMSGNEPPSGILDWLGNVRICFGAPVNYFAIPRTFFALPPRNPEPGHVTDALLNDLSRPAGSVETLETLIRSYLKDRPMTVDLAASLCGTSTRGLQRQLERAGTRFSAVATRVRFEMACELLRESTQSVRDIASTLHYADPSNFARAFRRIAGMNPAAYRKAIAATRPGRRAVH